MNPFEQILPAILARFSGARCVVDPAEQQTGSWFLDITTGNCTLVVEWRPDRGYAVSTTRDAVYGDGTGAFLAEPRAVTRRLFELLEQQPAAPAPLTSPDDFRAGTYR